MALHDPVQDDINRQIRSAIPARTRSRRFGIAGQVEDLVARGELTPEAGERVSLNARANFERDRRIAKEQEEARRADLEEKSAQAFLRRRQGEASLATANAALAKARTGGTNVSAAALDLLGIDPKFEGKVSPTTARAAGAQRSSADRLRQDRDRLKFQREKEESAKARRQKTFELSQVREARLQTAAQVKAILADQDISDEAKEKISFIVSQSLSKLQDQEVPPEVVDELFNEALGETFGDRKKAAVLAKKRARDRGFFVPE